MTKLQKENLINEIMRNENSYIPNGDQLNEDNLNALKPKQLEDILSRSKDIENNRIVKVYIQDNFGIVETRGAGIFKYKYEMDSEDKKDTQYFMDCVKESYKDSHNRDDQFIQLEVA